MELITTLPPIQFLNPIPHLCSFVSFVTIAVTDDDDPLLVGVVVAAADGKSSNCIFDAEIGVAITAAARGRSLLSTASSTAETSAGALGGAPYACCR